MLTVLQGKGFIMDTKKVIKYVIITYAIAWTIQTLVSLYVVNNPTQKGLLVFQFGLATCMFAPLIATLLVKADFKSIGWKPRFKGNIGWLIFAAYVALPLTVTGAVLFYVLFPDLFDTTGSYLVVQGEQSGVDAMAQLEAQGLNYGSYLALSLGPAIIAAPFLNISTAIGEEAGWRGFLYPELKKRFSYPVTWMIGGAIWAAFHFPAMLIAGYEYGTDYIGHPWLGLIVFTLFCIMIGSIEQIVYDKTKCIWYAALFHGSINAMLTLPPVFENAYAADKLEQIAVLGPGGTGLIIAIPFFILAIAMGISVMRKNPKTEAAS
jgi:membrane protease YdiL (CAAX protease family)